MQYSQLNIASLNISLVVYAMTALLVFMLLIGSLIGDARRTVDDAYAAIRFYARASSESIAVEVGAYRHAARLFVRERRELFERMLHTSDPDDLIFDFAEHAVAWFPDALAFTVADATGNPIVSDFKGNIGPVCLTDLKRSIVEQRHITPLHGVDTLPHFDISVPLKYDGATSGVLLVTFPLRLLDQHVVRHADSRFTLALTRHDQTDDIREGDVVFQAEDTEIQVVGRVRPAFETQQENHLITQMVIRGGGFLLFAVIGGGVLWRSRNQIIADRIAMEVLNRELYEQSMHDPLTGLYNRRWLEQQLPIIRSEGRRGRKPLVLATIDIDYFKRINDRLGHDAGDRCLQLFAKIIRNNARRPLDLAARLGGEEFLVCWYDTSEEHGLRMLRVVQEALRSSGFKHQDGGDITLSAGLYELQGSDQRSLKVILTDLDKALYCAKRNGRDRIETVSTPVIRSSGDSGSEISP